MVEITIRQAELREHRCESYSRYPASSWSAEVASLGTLWGTSPQKGYKVLFGEGAAPWKKLFAAAESKGGVEFYLIEQEGSEYPEMETAERCLAAFRKIRA
jgi:hypothetical protein